jgi:hypothetical protein
VALWRASVAPVIVVNVLDVLSSVLVLVGLVWGGVALLRAERRLRAQKAAITRIRAEQEALPSPERANLGDLLHAAGLPFSTYGDALTQRQDVELAVIAYLRPTLSWPFGLAVAGAVLGLVAAGINAFVS